MSALKYTDRDVRENKNFAPLVYDYLDDYEGEFPFLVDCKRRVDAGLHLHVGMIRGILNCMRSDPRLPYDLPEPLPPEEKGEVIPITKNKDKKKKDRSREQFDCPLYEAGIYHHHKNQDWKREGPNMRHCSGLYRLNRLPSTDCKATIHEDVLYVMGKSPATVLLHKPAWAFTHWPHSPHEYGWSWRSKLRYPMKEFDLHVKLGCKHPSWLTNPILLRQADVDEYNAEVHAGTVDRQYMWKSNGKAEPASLVKCPRCFP